MAPPDDTPAEGDDTSEYLQERHRVIARFIEMGGNVPIELDLAKLPKLADLVTDQHRVMVKDLTASGLPQEAVARILGISKERLQSLFDYELTTGYEIAHASLARSLYLKGLAGDTYATTSWLRLHNKGQWADKREQTDKGAQQVTAEIEAVKSVGQDLLASMLTAMSTDKALYKRPSKDKPPPVKVVQSDKAKPVKAGTTLKKVKGD